jgi:hypothetical protein
MGSFFSKNKCSNEEIINVLRKFGLIDQIIDIIFDYYLIFCGNMIYHEKININAIHYISQVQILGVNNNKIRFIKTFMSFSTKDINKLMLNDDIGSFIFTIDFCYINTNEFPTSYTRINKNKSIFKYENNFSLQIYTDYTPIFFISKLYNENYPEGCCIFAVYNKLKTIISIYDLLTKTKKFNIDCLYEIYKMDFLTNNLIICTTIKEPIIININDGKIMNEFQIKNAMYYKNIISEKQHFILTASSIEPKLEIWDTIKNKSIHYLNVGCLELIREISHNKLDIIPIINADNDFKIIIKFNFCCGLYIYGINNGISFQKKILLDFIPIYVKVLSSNQLIINTFSYYMFIFNIDLEKIELKEKFHYHINEIICISKYSFITFTKENFINNTKDNCAYYWNIDFKNNKLKYTKINSMYESHFREKKDNYIITSSKNGDICIYN